MSTHNRTLVIAIGAFTIVALAVIALKHSNLFSSLMSRAGFGAVRSTMPISIDPDCTEIISSRPSGWKSTVTIRNRDDDDTYEVQLYTLSYDGKTARGLPKTTSLPPHSSVVWTFDIPALKKEPISSEIEMSWHDGHGGQGSSSTSGPDRRPLPVDFRIEAERLKRVRSEMPHVH